MGHLERYKMAASNPNSDTQLHDYHIPDYYTSRWNVANSMWPMFS